jgi:hypothetical protein
MRSSTMLQTISWETPYKIHRNRKITEQEFDGHKREIAQLYVNEDLELDEVRRIMAQKFKFYGRWVFMEITSNMPITNKIKASPSTRST